MFCVCICKHLNNLVKHAHIIIEKPLFKLLPMMLRKSKRCCSVPECRTYGAPGISFHFFPVKNDVLCRKWQTAMKVWKPITKSMSVCSKHFVTQDFLPFTEKTRRKCLKKNAVPSKNVPSETYDTVINHNHVSQKPSMKCYVLMWDEMADAMTIKDDKDPLALDKEEQFLNSDIDREDEHGPHIPIEEIKVEIKEELIDT